jgi:hypothetical protein
MSKTTYTAQELDLTRAYVLLAHAEIESYCEDLVKAKSDRAFMQFDRTGKVTPILRRIVAYHVATKRKSWSEVSAPSAPIVRSAFDSYRAILTANHGVRRENLEKLLYPLGVPEPSLDQTWLAQMDSFGSNRGGFAHQTIGAVNPPDPSTERTNINQLVVDLLKLDRILSSMQ